MDQQHADADRARRRERSTRARWRPVFVVSASAVLLGLVVASPLLLAWATTWPVAWDRLSDVGQAYGTVSAILSALAFCAVAGSILMQRAQYRLTEEQAVRQRHFELLTFAMRHPRYMAAWGSSPVAEVREHDQLLLVFANLIMSHWYMLWRIGNISEIDLRIQTRTFFRGSVGREFWTLHGGEWTMAGDAATRRFLAVVSDEYRQAERNGPATPADTRDGALSPRPTGSAGGMTHR